MQFAIFTIMLTLMVTVITCIRICICINSTMDNSALTHTLLCTSMEGTVQAVRTNLTEIKTQSICTQGPTCPRESHTARSSSKRKFQEIEVPKPFQVISSIYGQYNPQLLTLLPLKLHLCSSRSIHTQLMRCSAVFNHLMSSGDM
jgi:hypothetical protein